MSCDDLRDQYLLYVTEALDPDERDELRAHLATGCPTCSGHLEEARAVLGKLPMALDPVQPSARAKARLMSRLDERATNTPPPDPSQHKPPAGRGGQSGRSLWSIAAMILVSGLAGAAIAAGMLYPTINRQRIDIAAMSARLTELSGNKESTERSLAEHKLMLTDLLAKVEFADLIERMLKSPTLTVIPLHATAADTTAWSRMIWDRAQNKGIFYCPSMLPAATGQTYRLYFTTDEKNRVAAASFNVDEAGRGTFDLKLPEKISEIAFNEARVYLEDQEDRAQDEPNGDSPLFLGTFSY